MDKEIQLKVRKDLDNKQQKFLLSLKGILIAKGYTDIIHISDEGEEFHINSFTPGENRQEVVAFIKEYCAEHTLDKIIMLQQ